MRYKNSVNIFDRVISALSYLTGGMVGFICWIILHIGKKHVSGFLEFNVTQSIFLSIIYFLLCVILNFIFGILSHIPFIQVIVAWIQLLFFRPILWDLSILQLFIDFVVSYLVIFSLIGRKPKIIGISELLERK